jgi:flotillin
MNPAVEGLIIALVVVVGLLLVTYLLGTIYRKVGPNRALIVYGKGGTKVVVGGGTLIIPLFQKSEDFNLELMSFDVAPSYLLYTTQGIPLKVEAITQLKVENEDEKIKRAANQFLSKSEDEREMMVRQVMEGHLRGIVGQLTVEQLVKDPELVSARMRETVAADLDKLGLEVVSFTLKDVTDESGYIQNMSRPEIARNKQMAEIAEAEMTRNVAIRSAETLRESAQARAKADQERVLAETLSKAAQAESQRDLEIKQAEYLATVSEQKAQADRAYDIQANITQQKLVEEKTKIDIVQKTQEAKVQEAEAVRVTAELLATVQRQAEAERERIRILAEAEQRRAILEAEGRAKAIVLQLESEADGKARAIRLQADADAAAIRARGEAEADATRLKGLAEADAVKACGLAEAESLRRRIDALNEQNQAAILNTALSGLPEIAGKLFEAYSHIGNVTYVASGDGDGVTSRITHDVIGMVPLLGAVFESTTGLKLRDLIAGQNGPGGTANGHAGAEADDAGEPRATDTAVAAGGTAAVTEAMAAPVVAGGALQTPGSTVSGVAS